MSEYNFVEIEKKWQNSWEENKLFNVEKNDKPKYYVLEMFPYPSGDGLHMGHALNYTIGDVYARFKLMNGFNVLHPMGYDALGLPAENAAIKSNTHPEDYTNKSITRYISQQKSLGITYDWNRVVNTASPDYYKWDQWIFLKMFEKGLAYQKESAVNWCPLCNTVLANEQVHDGCCWRHEETKVEVKHLKQWFFKTTAYAEELYDDIDGLDWPEKTKAMQKNWIGKSYGTEINFEINNENWPIFTTRPDTIYGVTFMVISAHHKKLWDLVTAEQKNAVQDFLKQLNSVSEKDLETMDKLGVFTGSYAINPVTNEKIPVYAGNFVVADYGAGMVMAVPAHDQRDFEFAKKYNITIKQVIDGLITETRAFTQEGNLINSDKFTGVNSKEAISKITDYLISEGKGRRVVNFKLRDWGVSRQRYWGTPIPIVHCEKCGAVAVAEKDLPVALPREVKFGEGNPLLTNQDWVNTSCPKCGGKAKRETDTMDTFVNSSWYYLRYADSKNNEKIFDSEKANYWCPIDQYIGGAEHACMHLIYIRFYTKFLADLGLINFREPAKKLFHQGMLGGEGGIKMSKSKGNVIAPETVSEKYGIDTARLFLLSLASPDKARDWSDKGIQGSLKIIMRIFEYFEKNTFDQNFIDSKGIQSKINKTIKEVTIDIEEFKYNLAIIKLRQLFEYFENQQISKSTANNFLKLLAPICPHIAEELWHKIGNKDFISVATWPKCDESKIDEQLEKIEMVVSSLRLDILKIKELAKIEQIKKVKIFVAPDWKWTALSIVQDACKERPDFNIAIKALMANDEMKSHGGEIQTLLKTIISKYTDFFEIKKFDEYQMLLDAKTELEKEFGVVEIIKAETSAEAKAKSAFPTKPALLVE
ncbi:MAG: leucine--tRNA ligase [Candidatus ainarchaeum sp.]|nr:leucine--tRNA ligase [Candidatus ainarchaeum sp.]